MRNATSDTKAFDRERAQDKQGMFIDKATGQLTPLGAEMQRVTGEVPGQETQVVRTGTKDGRRVRKLADGTTQIQNANGEWENL